MSADTGTERATARRRHPTALWVPDVDEMRRRLAGRGRSAAPPAELSHDAGHRTRAEAADAKRSRPH